LLRFARFIAAFEQTPIQMDRALTLIFCSGISLSKNRDPLPGLMREELSSMTFRITGLSPEPFKALYGLSDAELAERGIKRYAVDESPGFPDRIEMREGQIGETMLLLNHCHQPGDSPYRGTHAVFVREGASKRYEAVDEIPEVMQRRLLSLRGFSADHMLLEADVVQGSAIRPLIAQLFGNPAIAYIHVHNAKQGCYSGRIDRA
jgi:hypothetical protein